MSKVAFSKVFLSTMSITTPIDKCMENGRDNAQQPPKKSTSIYIPQI